MIVRNKLDKDLEIVDLKIKIPKGSQVDLETVVPLEKLKSSQDFIDLYQMQALEILEEKLSDEEKAFRDKVRAKAVERQKQIDKERLLYDISASSAVSWLTDLSNDHPDPTVREAARRRLNEIFRPT